jgi:hypothetical protein
MGFRENFFELGDQTGREGGERLVRLHEIEIEIRFDIKSTQHLVEDLPVLCRHADKGLPITLLAERLDEWAKLNSFGPRSENHQNAGFGVVLRKNIA